MKKKHIILIIERLETKVQAKYNTQELNKYLNKSLLMGNKLIRDFLLKNLLRQKQYKKLAPEEKSLIIHIAKLGIILKTLHDEDELPKEVFLLLQSLVKTPTQDSKLSYCLRDIELEIVTDHAVKTGELDLFKQWLVQELAFNDTDFAKMVATLDESYRNIIRYLIQHKTHYTNPSCVIFKTFGSEIVHYLLAAGELRLAKLLLQKGLDMHVNFPVLKQGKRSYLTIFSLRDSYSACLDSDILTQSNSTNLYELLLEYDKASPESRTASFISALCSLEFDIASKLIRKGVNLETAIISSLFYFQPEFDLDTVKRYLDIIELCAKEMKNARVLQDEIFRACFKPFMLHMAAMLEDQQFNIELKPKLRTILTELALANLISCDIEMKWKVTGKLEIAPLATFLDQVNIGLAAELCEVEENKNIILYQRNANFKPNFFNRKYDKLIANDKDRNSAAMCTIKFSVDNPCTSFRALEYPTP